MLLRWHISRESDSDQEATNKRRCCIRVFFHVRFDLKRNKWRDHQSLFQIESRSNFIQCSPCQPMTVLRQWLLPRLCRPICLPSLWFYSNRSWCILRCLQSEAKWWNHRLRSRRAFRPSLWENRWPWNHVLMQLISHDDLETAENGNLKLTSQIQRLWESVLWRTSSRHRRGSGPGSFWRRYPRCSSLY